MARPRKELTGEQVEQVEKMAGHGLTLDQIADCLNIGERTLERRFSEDTVVLAAYKRGKAVAINAVAKTVYQKAKAGEGAFPFFYLKTQAGWRETSRMEVSGPDGGPIETRVDGPSAADWLDTEVDRLRAREGTPEVVASLPEQVRRNGRGGH
jgi:hypothetical protein